MKINKRRALRTMGLTLLGTGIIMLPSLLYTLFSEDSIYAYAFAKPAFLLIITGLLIVYFVKIPSYHLKIRDGYMNIFIVIFTSAFFGAFPYFLVISSYIGVDCSFVDAIFESTAGLSTTSASAFYEPALPHCLLLWKVTQHWVGGVCILVFIISLLPQFGLGDQQIATVESHGTFANKIAPKSKKIALLIICIYSFFTVLAFIYFMIGKIGAYDAFVLALASISTSGVLTHPAGVSHYCSFFVEMGVSIFTILSSMSFVLYIHLLKGNLHEIKHNIEVRAFLISIAICTLVISFILFCGNTGKSFFMSLRDSFFQVASFVSTSGFALEDYTSWPQAACFVLMLLMIIGGCSASTTGAFKMIRILIVSKLIGKGFSKHMHPRVVKAVKLGDSTISKSMASSVTAFTILYLAAIIFSTIILSMQSIDIEIYFSAISGAVTIDMETCFSAVIGAISNDGISFGLIGMQGDYSMFTPVMKLFLCFLMVVGRLGLMTVLIVFLPSFWRAKKGSRTRRIK